MSHSQAAQLPRGLIVEMDFAVLPGHALMQDICRERLAAEGVAFDVKRAAKAFCGRSFTSGLNALCVKAQKTVDAAALAADCNARFEEALSAALSEMPSGFVAFVKAVLAKGVKVVLMTRADVEAVRARFGDCDPEKLIVSHETMPGFCCCGWEGWRRVARKHDLHERLCVAVAGSGLSVKGALTSGLGVIAKLHPLVEHQDISGSDALITEYSAGLVSEVCRILRI